MSKRRRTGKVDKLPPNLKNDVEQMLLSHKGYREIVKHLAENGEKMSTSAICTYAKKFKATTDMMTIAQGNFATLMEEMQKQPDLDISEALIRLAGHHVINALTNLDDTRFSDVPADQLIRETNSLIRATSYKKRIETQNKDDFDASLDAMKTLIFEVMAKENPELYNQVNEFLKSKKKEGDL